MGFSSKNTRMGCHFVLQGPLGYAKYKLGLAKSICQQLNDHRGICHLPVRLQVAELWHPVREFRVKNEALWAPGNRSLDCCHCSVSKSCLTLCNPMDYSSPAYPVFHYLQELAQTHVHWVSDAIQPSHLMSFPSPPALNFPSIRVFLFVCLFVCFDKESALHIRWPKYWSFSFSPSNGYSRLISFVIDLFDLLAVQGTLKRLL